MFLNLLEQKYYGERLIFSYQYMPSEHLAWRIHRSCLHFFLFSSGITEIVKRTQAEFKKSKRHSNGTQEERRFFLVRIHFLFYFRLPIDVKPALIKSLRFREPPPHPEGWARISDNWGEITNVNCDQGSDRTYNLWDVELRLSRYASEPALAY